MADTWLNNAFKLLVQEEGFDARPKWDVNAYRMGHGSDYVTLNDGTVQKVTRNTPPITLADAGRDLARQLPEYGNRVITQIGQDRWDGLSDAAKASLVSAAYNYGSLPNSLTGVASDPKSDEFDIAVALDKLGYNQGINNPERRRREATAILAYNNNTKPLPPNPALGGPAPALAATSGIVNVASSKAPSDDDIFSSAFSAPKTAAPATAAPKTAGPTDDDIFGAAFKPSAPAAASQPVAAAATPAAPVKPPNPYDKNDPRYRLYEQAPYDPNSLNTKAGSGIQRGMQDIGDTVSNWAMGLGSGTARLLANQGLLDPKIADDVEARTKGWDVTTAAGRKAWEEANPASYWGPIPTDAASWGRLGGQIAGTAPVLGPVAKAVGGVGEALISNPWLRSVVTGSALGGGQAALTSRASDQPLPDQILTGTALGGLFGAGAPVVMKAGKTVFDKLLGSEFSDKASLTFSNWLKEIGLTPSQANAELDRLGPDATYADLDEALRTKAAALAGRGGRTTQTVKMAFKERAQEGPARTAAKLDDILGPAPDVTATEDQIMANARAAAGPSYTKAHASGQQLDTQSVVDYLTDAAGKAKGDTAASLNKVKDYLYTKEQTPVLDKRTGLQMADDNGKPMTETTTKLDTSVQGLHAARVEIDDDIAALKKMTDPSSARRGQINALQSARGQVDDLLKTNPDMKAGDEVFAQQMKVKEAFQTGRDVFKNTTRKEDLERTLAGATPEQKQAIIDGARAAINDTLTNTARGELSGAETMFGKKSANRDKLTAVFGDKADQVLDLISANQSMRATENAVLAPSKTAELQAAQKEFQFQPKSFESWLGPIAAGWFGVAHGLDADAAAGVSIGFKALMNAINTTDKKAIERSSNDLAKMLSLRGTERDKIGNALATAQKKAKIGSAAQETFRTGAKAAVGAINMGGPAVNPFASDTRPRAVALPPSRF